MSSVDEDLNATYQAIENSRFSKYYVSILHMNWLYMYMDTWLAI